MKKQKKRKPKTVNLEPSPSPAKGTKHSLEDIYDVLKAFKKMPEEVCDGTIFLGLRADGTIGELIGTKVCIPLVTTITTIIASAGDRFKDNNNGTVTDTRTQLVWLKNANPYPQGKNWAEAVSCCSNLKSEEAGLTDGSKAGQWRLPTMEELEGIGTNPSATWSSCYPAVPWTTPGEPFMDVQSGYWTTTTDVSNPYGVRFVNMHSGFVGYFNKGGSSFFVWPVRSEQ